jgi:predicted secreted protein
MRFWGDVSRSVDVVISMNDKPLGAQTEATLNRSASAIEITNKINDEWEENLVGKKSWNIDCGGLYVVDNEALQILEQAFMKSEPITVKFGTASLQYSGKALITDFPLEAVYDEEFKYSLKLLGTGPLYQEG